MNSVTKIITSGDTWTGPIPTNNGHLAYTIQGDTWDGTVTIQRSFDDGVTWFDIKDGTFTQNESKNIYDPTDMIVYRMGSKNGDFTSGSVSVRLDQ